MPSLPQRLSALALAFALAGAAVPRAAADLSSAAAAPVAAGGAAPRPRIGLVLSGGGARGAAHVGVLKVLEELRVPVDAIAGTSMGAVVGGLYAAGKTPAEIERLMNTVDWQDAFSDRAPRGDLDFRRKQDDRDFLVRLPMGLKGRRFQLPRGLISGQKLARVLRAELHDVAVAEVEDFDRLPVPFRAVATDLETGERVVLGSGDLVTALRASMSAPGVFTPVERDGRLLVDGGIAENLPIDVARAMGVDRLIVVDVTYEPQPRRDLNSAIEVSNQMVAILIRRDTLRQIATLGPDDVLLDPALGALGSTEFDQLDQAAALGAAAARAQAGRLAALALDEPGFRDWQARRRLAAAEAPVLSFVEVAPESQRYHERIDAALEPVLGRPLDPQALDRALARLYGDDIFESLDYRLLRRGDEAGLHVRARRKSYGPNYVRFGLQLQDDFAGGTAYTAGARFQVTEANRYGAEWVTDLRIGANPGVVTELYQPLGYASPWFVAPRIRWESRDLQVQSGTRQLAAYRVSTRDLGLDFGRELSNWGELRAGLLVGETRQRIRIGDPADAGLPSGVTFQRGEAFVRASVDQLDSVLFPRAGHSLLLQWNAGREGLGADFDSDVLRADALAARTFGRNTAMLWLSAGQTVDGPETALGNYFSLGGLFNLSGLAPNSLTGPHFGMARALFYRRIGRGGPGFLNVPTYAGVSLEWGETWQRRRDVSLDGGRANGALFVGLDTVLGPIYVAAGFDEDGESAFYLLLGRTF